MSPTMVFDLVQLLEVNINNQDVTYIPVPIQVLCTLRFLAEGSFQKGASQDFQHPVSSQPTFSRCLNRVINALCSVAHNWIQFPQNRQERQQVAQRFAEINRVLNIIGLIDCTVIKILRPPQNEEAFYNHEHKHSLNVQMICNADKVIFDVRICPGSNNDRSIWKYSDARHHLRSWRLDPNVRREGDYYLLGDSGYNPSPIILTPIRNAIPGSSEALYTRDLCRTRCIVEQLFGQLSHIFISGSRRRVLYYRPEKAAKIVLSICVIHNFKILHGIRRGNQDRQPILRQNILRVQENNDYYEGIITRAILIERHYGLRRANGH